MIIWINRAFDTVSGAIEIAGPPLAEVCAPLTVPKPSVFTNCRIASQIGRHEICK